jgi:hypothetical protein
MRRKCELAREKEKALRGEKRARMPPTRARVAQTYGIGERVLLDRRVEAGRNPQKSAL